VGVNLGSSDLLIKPIVKSNIHSGINVRISKDTLCGYHNGYNMSSPAHGDRPAHEPEMFVVTHYYYPIYYKKPCSIAPECPDSGVVIG
jgi:hypothetical protein